MLKTVLDTNKYKMWSQPSKRLKSSREVKQRKQKLIMPDIVQ